MRRYFLYFLLALHGWALCSLQSAALPSRPSLSEADSLFHERNQETKLRRAWDLYEKAYQKFPSSSEAAWKFSMACQSLAARYLEGEDQKSLFQLGAEVAKKAAEKNPDCGPCQFWAAINMAQYGEKVGVVKMLFTLSEIIERLEKAAELDPYHAMAGPHRVLGTIYQVLPGILGGDSEKAEGYFKKSIALSPEEAVNYLSFAKLLKDEGLSQEAARIAEKGLKKLHSKKISLESQESENELRSLALDYRK